MKRVELKITISVSERAAETKITCDGITLTSSVEGNNAKEAALKSVSAISAHALDVIETVEYFK